MHFLAWGLILILLFVTTDQVFESVIPLFDAISLTPIFGFIAMTIFLFYINYILLVPKYFHSKNYWHYFAFLILFILCIISITGFLFYIFDFDKEKLNIINPNIVKIIPVIFANGLLILTISAVGSILLAINNRLKQTEKEKLSAQISSLKSQINPHFLFNTLNNIYATAIDTSPKAAEMVDRLAEMMRYTMKDTQQDFVQLEDEINYIDNFIELQKLRLDKSVKLEYSNLEYTPALQIAPMLLIPFIENAFKHGVNSEQKSHIKIEIVINKTGLQLTVLNNKVNIQKIITESSGLGIENTRHRLNLIYPSKHLLVINDSEKEFFVSLHINL